MDVGESMLRSIILNELVRTETRAATLAVHQRIGKSADMTAGHPGFGVHENRGVHADIIGRFLYKFSPPGALDVILKLHAERAIIPAVGKAAVDLAAGIDKAAPLAERDDLFHRIPGRFLRLS
ncbi:hypothetical protein SDC9_111335 [bioreactor metagenome]|uniref:Uncharacterized protein n=1 Tax=bioreactor metagenome TaxID=1076179 RepID=A0A645BG85_9ZZZZ